MAMATIEQIRGILQERHRQITGVKTAPVYPPRKIETSQLPCVLLRTAQGKWGRAQTGDNMQERTFVVEVLLEPLPQNLFAVNERLIDQLIQAFGDHYYQMQDNITSGTWILYNSLTDSGWQVLRFGTEYVGFTFDLTIRIGG
jgi:hypothetical protein